MGHAEILPPPTADRVRHHTADRVNARIDRAARQRLATAQASGREALRARLDALDGEWDVDRALMANFAIVGGANFAWAVIDAARRGRRWTGWHTLFATQLGFLLFHAVRGWCPPLPVFRRLGFRTWKEIATEREETLASLGGAPRESAVPSPT
jgi:hypothetical protein